MTRFFIVPDEFDGLVFNPSKIHAVLDGILTGLTGLTGYFISMRMYAHMCKEKSQNKSSNPSNPSAEIK